MEQIRIPTKIFSGNDSLDWLQTLKGKKILMVCDAFLPNTPTLDKIKGEVDGNNDVSIFSDVKPDPPLTNIMEGVEQFGKIQPNVIVGIGGGSAIDTGKAIRFFGEKVYQHKIETFVAIPTTSGTGSEVTNTSVVSDTKNHTKMPIMKDYLTPDIALLDPQLVMTAPKSVTAFSGLDVLTHSLESLVSRDANTITDALAEKGIDVITHCLVECYKHGDNEAARKVVHEASCAAGIAFNNAGLGICHSLAHQLGANFHVPHGLACAMLLPHVVEYNASHSETALHKYGAAIKKTGLVSQGMSDRIAVQRIAAKIRQMMVQMDCPQTLRAFGIDPAEAEKKTDVVVADAKKDGTFPGNPVVPTDDDLKAIYDKVIK
ncbi:1-propanol dehydrogenase PduQ [Lentilactobacillus kisonensis]|uniref:Propanol dehydrogenase n=2 Tax=Lentilactobacillus kisonensis TaxID=481722 RepID=A0A0R1NX18_9LACO|nr:1-propanol dehydrogenase PduQ [Lentilactobacillus kisonensis]KRL22154.1 propanol dehydrogenase [Lentilactobacillus kisonensis DSM 19906 = JCM 15041]